MIGVTGGRRDIAITIPRHSEIADQLAEAIFRQLAPVRGLPSARPAIGERLTSTGEDILGVSAALTRTLRSVTLRNRVCLGGPVVLLGVAGAPETVHRRLGT